MIRGEIKKGFFTQREVELGTTLSEKVGKVETFDVFYLYSTWVGTLSVVTCGFTTGQWHYIV